MNVGGSVVARRFLLVHMLLVHMIGAIDGCRVRAGGRAA